VEKARRVTQIVEIFEILDWSVILPLFKKLPLNFTKNYFFFWSVPEDDAPLVLSMSKFGGLDPCHLVLADSTAKLRQALSNVLFKKKGSLSPSAIFKQQLVLEKVPPRGVTTEKLQAIKKCLKLIPVQHHSWYKRYPAAPKDSSLVVGCASLAGTQMAPQMDMTALHDAAVTSIRNKLLSTEGNFYARFAASVKASSVDDSVEPQAKKQKVCVLEPARPIAESMFSKNVADPVGYLVFRSACRISSAFLTKLVAQSSEAAAIFNHNLTHKENDKLRLQFEFPQEWMPPSLSKLLAPWLKDRIQKQWVALVSLPGCRSQAAHTDWDPTIVPWDSHATRPIAVLVALENDTGFNVWPRSHSLFADLGQGLHRDNVKMKHLELNAGDVVVFDGVLIHGGAAFEERNLRLHCYLDVDGIDRAPNETWIVAEDAQENLKILIEDLL
jgi:hypothetical protein